MNGQREVGILSADKTPRVRPARTWRRAWLFRIAALLLGFVPLLAIEAGLRLCGIGRNLSLIVPCANAPGWYQLNPRFDEPFYGRGDLSGPEPRPFRLPKPAGTRRILVVGGSTVVGFPYSSELAFPRHLQVMLQAQASTGETIEVLNAGITALNSSAEVAVVAEGLTTDPDVIVIYSGHNEFYGPGGVASTAGWFSPRWYRAIASWKRLYLLQGLTRLTTAAKPSAELVESLPGDLHIAYQGPKYQQAVKRFEQNLTAMADLARRAHIPAIFVGPVANERHQPPIENLFGDLDSAERPRWQEHLRLGERQLLWGDKTKARQLLEQARAERPDDPLILFRLAQTFERLGRADEAVSHYRLALDRDGCRFRAPTAFQSIVEAVATQFHADGACFVDLHSAICRDDVIAAPGRKHLLEHVHFSWNGNRVTADVIARCVHQRIWSGQWSDERAVDDARLRRRLAVQPEDHLAALGLAMMIYQQSPFRKGADAEKLAKELVADSVLAFADLPAERQKLFERLTTAELSRDLLQSIIRQSRSAKRDELLGVFLRAQLVRQPWSQPARKELVDWLRGHNMASEGEQIQQLANDWPGSGTP